MFMWSWDLDALNSWVKWLNTMKSPYLQLHYLNMLIHLWTYWMNSLLRLRDYLESTVLSIMAFLSKTCPNSEDLWKISSSLIIPLRVTHSSLKMECRSYLGTKTSKMISWLSLSQCSSFYLKYQTLGLCYLTAALKTMSINVINL